MSDSRLPAKRAAESPPTGTELAARVTASRFADWYRKREIRENIRNGTPYFNGPAPIQSPARHSPSQLLQCHRQIAYRQLNAPEETDDPTGIFWIGSKFEEEVALPFLRDAVTESNSYACNSLWVDFEVTPEPDGPSLHIKGETDPVIVTRDGEPLLVTEIKTKSNVENLENPNRHHKAQAHAYMYGLSEKHDRQVTDAVIVYAGRTTFDVVAFHVEFDPSFWEDTVLEWAATHSEYRLDQDLPPADPEYEWECEFCSYKVRCGKAETAHEDLDPVGFIPGYAEYPREKVREYLKGHDDAKLTPTLAHRFADLATTHDAYDWYCQRCDATYEWDTIEPPEGTGDLPLCPTCLADDDPVPVRGPAPADQHELSRGDDNA